MKKSIDIKFIAESAIIAALYAALTWLFAPISYGPVQFRISEVLVLLVVLNPKYAISLIIGCFVANTTSSLGWYDMLFGTLATTIAIIPMIFIRKMPIAAFFPVLSNAFIVSFELGLAFDLWGAGFWYNVWTVGLGEFVVLYFLGIPVMTLLAKDEAISSIMELDSSKALDLKINSQQIFSITLAVLGVILFIAYPMYQIGEDNYSLLTIANNGSYYLWVFIGLCVLFVLIFFIGNKLIRLISSILIILCVFAIYVVVGIINTNCLHYFYYYLVIIYPILLISLSVYSYKKYN